ncbi:MAG: 4'-phosphopantetheinyl transferase superfamily protein [Firmicutes bacterium]|nr:4'-phosphopantetheinyl transferase superfamily protein [Bacillota bacterium]
MSVYLYLKKVEAGFSSAACLMEAAAAYAGDSGQSMPRELRVARKGKPSFLNWPGVEFNVSHSGGYWLAAFARTPLGVDIQEHRPCDRDRLTARYFHPEEREWIAGQEDKTAAFFAVWTAKEARGKLSGEGIAVPLARFSTVGDPRCRRLELAAGYSVCLYTEEEDILLRELS